MDLPMDPDVTTILAAAPEFAGRYLDLVEAVDDEPPAATAFGELADFAAHLALQVERHQPVLIRLLAGVEAVARTSPDAEELVGWGFLDSLSPDDLRRVEPWLGPATRAVLDAMDLPGGGARVGAARPGDGKATA